MAVNNKFERMWIEWPWPHLRYHLGACLEWLRKLQKTSVSIVSVWQRFKLGTSEFKSLKCFFLREILSLNHRQLWVILAVCSYDFLCLSKWILVQYLQISHNHLAPNPQLLTIHDLSISFYVIETPSLTNLKVGHKNQQTDIPN